MLDPALAAKVAWYSAGAGGVLGPKGWYCFGTYGSDGTILFLAPTQIRSADVLADAWRRSRAGPGIELRV